MILNIFIIIFSLVSAIIYILKIRDKFDLMYLAECASRLYLALIFTLHAFPIFGDIDSGDPFLALLVVIGTDILVGLVKILGRSYIEKINNTSLITTLKNLGDKYSILVENSVFGIFTTTTEGKIEFVNQKLAAVLELPRENLIGRNLFEFLDASCSDAILKQKTFNCSFVNIISAKGTQIKAQVNGGSTVNGHATVTGSIHFID